jgi:hypothetical protein
MSGPERRADCLSRFTDGRFASSSGVVKSLMSRCGLWSGAGRHVVVSGSCTGHGGMPPEPRADARSRAARQSLADVQEHLLGVRFIAPDSSMRLWDDESSSDRTVIRSVLRCRRTCDQCDYGVPPDC